MAQNITTLHQPITQPTEALNDWLKTSFGRIYLRSCVDLFIAWQEYIPLAASAYGYGDARDDTEWQAMTLILKGYIPGSMYQDDMYARAPKVIDTPIDIKWIEAPQRVHRDAVGIKCTKCKKRKAVSDFKRGTDPKSAVCHACNAHHIPCSVCNQFLSINAFGIDERSTGRYGRKSQCRRCEAREKRISRWKAA